MLSKTVLIIGILVLAVVIIAIIVLRNFFGPNKALETVSSGLSRITGGGFNIDSDTKRSVDISKLRQGCPGGKDCIPSIDNPKFILAGKANFLNDDDVVAGLEHKGLTRAYPQKILNWHEIVNDTVAGDPIMVTFCPLCYTFIAFKREVNGQSVEFGVSGKLVSSNLVMYDRSTDTLWGQLTGEAIVGELTGTKLEQVPLITTIWGDWKKDHPDTQVLSTETGFSRNYDSYPYGSYEVDRDLLFPPEESDDRLHPKAVVFGIEINGKLKAYSDEALSKAGKLSDKIGGVPLEITWQAPSSKTNPQTGITVPGKVKIVRTDTQDEILPKISFWFAWFAFHPDTELFK